VILGSLSLAELGAGEEVDSMLRFSELKLLGSMTELAADWHHCRPYLELGSLPDPMEHALELCSTL
jgi:hypothetical protein